jgi:regulatory protein
VISNENENYSKAKSKIEAYCVFQDRCLSDILKKLEIFQLSKEDEKSLLLHLQKYGFWDELRFAESFVNGKFKIKSWGKQKIVQALKAKKVSSEIIQQAIALIPEEDNLETIKKLAWKKSESLKKEINDWTKRQKVIRFLVSKGFIHDDIAKVFGHLENEDN